MPVLSWLVNPFTAPFGLNWDGGKVTSTTRWIRCQKKKIKGALFTGAGKEGKNLKDNIAMQRLHCSDGRDG